VIGKWTDGGDVIVSSVSQVPLHRIRADSCLGCGPGLYCHGLGRRPATGWIPGIPVMRLGCGWSPAGRYWWRSCSTAAWSRCDCVPACPAADRSREWWTRRASRAGMSPGYAASGATRPVPTWVRRPAWCPPETGRCLPPTVGAPARSGHTPWPGCMAGW